jgi:glyoxylate carboligase
MKLSGGDLLMRALKDEGVKFIFGYPGGAALHIYDSIFKQKACEHILVRHEQGATHAADGYSRATGKPGVALGYFRPWCNECNYRTCNCLHGLYTTHCYLRSGSKPFNWN